MRILSDFVQDRYFNNLEACAASEESRTPWHAITKIYNIAYLMQHLYYCKTSKIFRLEHFTKVS